MASERRFLVLMNPDGYYGVMANAIIRSLQAEGVEVKHLPVPVPSINREVDTDAVTRACEEYKPTDTLAINLSRDFLGVPEGVEHHVWVHDIYQTGIQERPIFGVAWMGIAQWTRERGGFFLPPASDYATHLPGETPHIADVCFVGSLPPPYVAPDDDPETRDLTGKLQESVRLELEDSHNYRSDPEYAAELLQRAAERTGVEVPEKHLGLLRHHVSVRLTRFVQRRRAMDIVVPMCVAKGWSLALVGANWDKIGRFEPFAAGEVPVGPAAAGLFGGCKVSLHLNGDSNAHWRVMDILASGGVAMAEAHPGDGDPGGLFDLFGDSVPTFGSSDDLAEKLSDLISDDGRRGELAERGRAVVAGKHTYEARIPTLLSGDGWAL